ncbi:hypothetical protein K493DRAFT_320615 [Basidiobolus meristosporus CBS 931.73]|uniref:C2H2-type domain-containing protein n=1 Tax=Basidiobolus meristosporus CBS 931.73 TaxID=1314790 RepID=A0A1Y1X761_9FUNG|nr:hypothetical protein K493DRAFT_320615 [Basidiobolus meristosporus CBS 931.73]|eukprot:ORX81623.1 hypothetical protein K493DRAFT_320615 [Basidiobolus meristosporus CBS 931.73]
MLQVDQAAQARWIANSIPQGIHTDIPIRVFRLEHKQPKSETKRLSVKTSKHCRRLVHCHICKRAFYRYDNLTRHLRTHTGERPHECTVTGCAKKFARTDQLARHMRTHMHGREKSQSCSNSDRSDSDGEYGSHSGSERSLSPTTFDNPSPSLMSLQFLLNE